MLPVLPAALLENGLVSRMEVSVISDNLLGQQKKLTYYQQSINKPNVPLNHLQHLLH